MGRKTLNTNKDLGEIYTRIESLVQDEVKLEKLCVGEVIGVFSVALANFLEAVIPTLSNSHQVQQVVKQAVVLINEGMDQGLKRRKNKEKKNED